MGAITKWELWWHLSQGLPTRVGRWSALVCLFASSAAAFQVTCPSQRRRCAPVLVLCSQQHPKAEPTLGANTTFKTLGLRQALPRLNTELDGRIRRVLVPSSIAFLVVPLTNAVDTAWIGRMGDPLALAGQSAANSPFYTAFMVVSFLPTVMAPLVAGAIGAGDMEAARERIGEVLFLSTVFGLLGTLLLVGFPQLSLGLVLGSSSPALAHAEAYLRLRALSLVPALWESVGFAAFRGLQDARTPLKISVASNLFNAIVDPVLIFACSLGVAGAAIATALAELGAGLTFLYMLSRAKLLRMRAALTAPRLSRLWPLLAAGSILQLRNIGLNLAFVYATRVAQMADQSGVQAAAYSISMQYWYLGGVILSALQASAASIVPSERARAQAVDGQGQEGGHAAACRAADRLMRWGLVVGVLLSIVQLLALPALRLFTSVDAVLDAARQPAVIASLMQVM